MSTASADSYTTVEYVVKYRRPGSHEWLTWPSAGTNIGARATFRTLVCAPNFRRTQYKLIRRISRITEELVEQTDDTA